MTIGVAEGSRKMPVILDGIQNPPAMIPEYLEHAQLRRPSHNPQLLARLSIGERRVLDAREPGSVIRATQLPENVPKKSVS